MRYLFFIALVAAATPASAQVVPRESAAPTSLTIEQAIELARRNNPELQQTLNNRIGARAAVRSAYGALLPSADASLSAQRQQGGQHDDCDRGRAPTARRQRHERCLARMVGHRVWVGPLGGGAGGGAGLRPAPPPVGQLIVIDLPVRWRSW